MKRFSFGCFLTVLLVLCVAAQAPQPLHLLGYVVDAETGKPLQGVEISAVLAGQTEVTDFEGFFRLELRMSVRPGKDVRIHLEKQGYQAIDLTKAASEEVPYRIPLPPLHGPHGKRPSKPAEQPPPTQGGPAPVGGHSVREEGLALQREIMGFLSERRLNEPFSRQLPGSSMVIGPCDGRPAGADGTPIYMQETRRIFADQFQARISEVHDELSSRGLQDRQLEAIYKCVGLFAGNVDNLIERLADAIRRLAELVPPQDLYSGLNDQELAATALSEADAMDARIEKAMKELPNATTPDAVRSFFSSDFGECCLNQVEYLRAEVLHRLGPSAYDEQEMDLFIRLTEMKSQPLGSVALVGGYAPHFRRLAVKMKRKAAPLSPPVVLAFSETQLGPGAAKPGTREFSHRLLVTLQAPKIASSGYLVVLFTSRAGVITTDFPDGKFVVPSEVIENPPLSRVLSDPTTLTYALQIGRTPILPTTPLHVLAIGDSETHVSQALLFEY